MRSQEGTIIGVLGTYEDITDKKRSEETLRGSEERNRKILKLLPLPLAFVNNDGKVAFINERFIQVFGYTLEEILTLKAWWKRAYPDPDYRMRVLRQREDLVRNAATNHADIMPSEYHVTGKNGEERIMVITGITLGNGFLATFVDRH